MLVAPTLMLRRWWCRCGWAAGLLAGGPHKRGVALSATLSATLSNTLSEESPRSLRWVSGGSPVGRRTALAALTLRVLGDLFMYYDFIVRQRLAAGDGLASSWAHAAKVAMQQQQCSSSRCGARRAMAAPAAVTSASTTGLEATAASCRPRQQQQQLP